MIKHYHVGTTVVFDGYDAPSTKSAEQNRRAKYSADIVVTPNLQTTTSQSAFHGNNCNKSHLIQTPDLRSIGITLIQADPDADVLIVSTEMEMSKSHNDQPVVFGGTVTDLLASASASMDPFMQCHSNPVFFYSITQLQQALGSKRQHILFLHAITGCDTTSALYGQGKVKTLKLAQKNVENMSSYMNVFAQTSSTHEDVATAGEQFMLKLYGAERFATLNKYRHMAYKRLVAKTPASGTFTLASLPPTTAAAMQHSYRVSTGTAVVWVILTTYRVGVENRRK